MNLERKVKDLWSIVLVELTNYCNFSCEFCPSDSLKRKRQHMPKKLWQKVIREIGEKKMSPVIFLHLLGEPLLHREVFEAIELANSLGVKVSLYTNGALLNEEKDNILLDTLKKGRIVLSLQEIAPVNFDKRSRNYLSWDEYVKKLQRFTVVAEEKGVPLQVHCMVDIQSLGWNIKKILKEQTAVQDVYNEWSKVLNNKNPRAINIFDPAKSYSLGKTSSFFVKHHGWWSNRFIPDYAEVIPNEKGHCSLMTDTFAILSDGTCTYCCSDYEGELGLGNANDTSLEDIYYNERSMKIREAEKKGNMSEEICQICQGKLVNNRNNKPMLNRNIISNFYFLKDHFKRYGVKSSIKKVLENLRRRTLR